MKLVASTVLGLAVSVSSAAQEVQITPRLVAGQEFRLEVIRSREDLSRPQNNYSSRTRVDVRVVSVGPAGFVIDWKPGLSVLEGSATAMDPVMRVAGKAMGDIALRIALGPDGGFDRVTNESDVIPTLQAVVDMLIREAARGVPEAEAKRAEAVVRSILTPANLVTLASQDIQTYVSMFGAEMAVGGTVEAKIDRPSPLGGEALPAVLRVHMPSATLDVATIQSTVTYDGEALKAMTAGILARADGAAPPEELAKLKLEMSDSTKYVFDRVVGLFREVSNERRIQSGHLNRVDRLSIKLVTPPKR